MIPFSYTLWWKIRRSKGYWEHSMTVTTKNDPFANPPALELTSLFANPTVVVPPRSVLQPSPSSSQYPSPWPSISQPPQKVCWGEMELCERRKETNHDSMCTFWSSGLRNLNIPLATGMQLSQQPSIRKSDCHFARTFVLIAWLSV